MITETISVSPTLDTDFGRLISGLVRTYTMVWITFPSASTREITFASPITKATKAIEPRPFAKASASFSADMPPIMPTTIIVMIITASIKSKVRLLSPPIRG